MAFCRRAAGAPPSRARSAARRPPPRPHLLGRVGRLGRVEPQHLAEHERAELLHLLVLAAHDGVVQHAGRHVVEAGRQALRVLRHDAQRRVRALEPLDEVAAAVRQEARREDLGGGRGGRGGRGGARGALGAGHPRG